MFLVRLCWWEGGEGLSFWTIPSRNGRKDGNDRFSCALSPGVLGIISTTARASLLLKKSLNCCFWGGLGVGRWSRRESHHSPFPDPGGREALCGGSSNSSNTSTAILCVCVWGGDAPSPWAGAEFRGMQEKGRGETSKRNLFLPNPGLTTIWGGGKEGRDTGEKPKGPCWKGERKKERKNVPFLTGM